MTNRVVLNNIDHHDLKVALRHGAAFGDAVNQVTVFPTEFEAVQREFPILFRRDGEGVLHAVALLGLDRDENLFLVGDRWTSRYVPALQQRGPFSIGLQAPEDEDAPPQPMIHIDLDDGRVGMAEGEPVFLPHGGNAPYLDHVSNVLRAIYVGIDTAPAMYATLEELGVIQQVALDIRLSDDERYSIPDYATVSHERLAALGGADLERLNAQGFLYPAFLAAASLSNIAALIERKNAKRAG